MKLFSEYLFCFKNSGRIQKIHTNNFVVLWIGRHQKAALGWQ